jgi:uroporphyrinogen-III synthase
MAEGATVVEFPVVTIGPPPAPDVVDTAIQRIDAFRWVVFCHVSALRIFLDRFRQLRGGIEPLAKACSLAAVGPQRQAAVEAYGLTVELTSAKASPTELVKALVKNYGDLTGMEILVVSGEPTGSMSEDLERLGAVVTFVQSAQRTINLERHSEVARLVNEGRITAVVFLSPGGVAQFQRALERYESLAAITNKVAAYAMSPKTVERAKTLGFKELRFPSKPSREALLETICRDFQS